MGLKADIYAPSLKLFLPNRYVCTLVDPCRGVGTHAIEFIYNPMMAWGRRKRLLTIRMFCSLVTHHHRSSTDQYGQALVVTKHLKGHVDEHLFLAIVVFNDALSKQFPTHKSNILLPHLHISSNVYTVYISCETRVICVYECMSRQATGYLQPLHVRFPPSAPNNLVMIIMLLTYTQDTSIITPDSNFKRTQCI